MSVLQIDVVQNRWVSRTMLNTHHIHNLVNRPYQILISLDDIRQECDAHQKECGGEGCLTTEVEGWYCTECHEYIAHEFHKEIGFLPHNFEFLSY